MYEYVYIRVMCRYDFIMLLLFRNILSVSYVRIISAFHPIPSWNYCSKGEELQGKWFSSQPPVAEAAFEPTTCRSYKWFTRTISSPWDLLRNRRSLRASKLQNELEKHLTISLHVSDWKLFLHIQQVMLTIGSFKMPAGESYPKHASWHV